MRPGFHGVSDTRTDAAVVAYDATSGSGLWSAMYNQDQQMADPTAPVVSPDGSKVYVAMSVGDKVHGVVTTAAFDGATGGRVWTENDESAGVDYPAAVAVSEDGSRVFVAGSHMGYSHYYDYLTIAYAA